MNRQVGSCSWDGGHMVRLGHYLPMSSPLTTPMPVSVKPSTPTAVNPSNPMSLTHDRPTSPMFRTQTVTTPSPQSTPSLPRSSPWDTAKSRMVQLNSKCGANCRHAGRSSTSGGSPESSEPNSPTISRMDNHSQNCNVSASQPMDIPTPKRGVSPVCNYLDNSSRHRRSSLIASQGSIRVTSPPMRRRNSLIATQSSFKITSPPMRRRSSLIATQSSFKITSPPVPRCNNVIATQSSFTITSPPMRRRNSLIATQSSFKITSPPMRRRNSLIATQSSFKITSPPMHRRNNVIATQSSFKITSPPMRRRNSLIATQSSFTITSPPMRRRGSLLTSQSHILATNPPVTCKTPVSGDSWEPRSNCQSDYCSEDSRSSSNSPVHQSKNEVSSEQDSPVHQSKNEVSSEQDSPVHQSKTTGTGKQGSPVHQSKTTGTGKQGSPVHQSKTTGTGKQDSPVHQSKTTGTGKQGSPVHQSKTTGTGKQGSPVHQSKTTGTGKQGSPVHQSKTTGTGKQGSPVHQFKTTGTGKQGSPVHQSKTTGTGKQDSPVHQSKTTGTGKQGSPVHQSKTTGTGKQDSPVHQFKTTGTGKQGSPVHQSKTGKRRDSIESLSNSSRSSSSSDLSGSSSLRSSHTRPRNSRSGSKRSRTLENTSASDTTIVNSSFAVPSGRKTSVSPAPRTQKPRKEINAERDMQKEIKGLLITAVKGDQQKNIKESPVASERDQQKVIAESPIIAEGNQQEGITEPPIAVEGYQQESIRGLLVSGDNDLPHFGKHQSETDKSRKSNGVNGVETKSTDSSENTKSMADSEKKTTAATGNIDTMIENLNKSRRSTGNVNGRSRSIIDDIVRSKNITESGRKSKTLIDIEKKTRNLSDIVKSKSFTDYTRKPKVSSDETKKPKVLTDDAKKLRSSVDDTKTRRSLFDDMKRSKSLSDDARKTKYLSETPKKPTNDMRRPRSLCDSTRKPKSLSEDSKKSKSASDTQSNTLTAAIQNFKSSVDVGKKSLGVSSEVQKTRSLFSGDEDGSKPKTIHNKVRKQNTSSDDLRKIKVSNGSNRETSLNGIANRPATLSNNKTNRVTSNTLNKNNPLIIIGDVNKSEVSGNDEVDGLMTGWAMSDSGIMTGDEDNSPMEFLHIPSIVVENTAATDDEDKSTMRTEDRSWLSEAQLQVTDDEDRPWPSEAQLQATDDEDRSWLSEAQLQVTDDEDRPWPSEAQLQATDDEDRSWLSEAQLQATDDEDRSWLSEAQLQATDDEDRSWPSEAQLQATDDGTEDRSWLSEAQLQATDDEDRSWPSEAQLQATDDEDRSWPSEAQLQATDDEDRSWSSEAQLQATDDGTEDRSWPSEAQLQATDDGTEDRSWPSEAQLQATDDEDRSWPSEAQLQATDDEDRSWSSEAQLQATDDGTEDRPWPSEAQLQATDGEDRSWPSEAQPQATDGEDRSWVGETQSLAMDEEFPDGRWIDDAPVMDGEIGETGHLVMDNKDDSETDCEHELSRGNVEENDMWENFQLVPSSPTTQIQPYKRVSREGSMFDTAWMSQSWHGCEEFMDGNFDLAMESGEVSQRHLYSTYRKNNNREHRSRSSSVGSDRSSSWGRRGRSRSSSISSREDSRCNSRASNCKEVSCSRNSSSIDKDYGTKGGILDPCPLSRSVGEEFMGYHRRSMTKFGSLTNICDSFRPRVRGVRDSYSSSRSLGNLHETLTGSIANLKTARSPIRGNFGAKDEILEKLDTMMHKYKGSRSTSCLNKDLARGNFDKMVPWGSVRKLPEGWENIKQCVTNKTTLQDPQAVAGMTYKKERLPEKRISHRWEKLRLKVLEKKRRVNRDKANSVFQEGGGEEESEWVNAGEVKGDAPLKGLQSRTPRFSEIFGGNKDVRKARQEMIDGSRDQTMGKKRKSRKRKSKGMPRSKEKGKDDTKTMEWKYTKSLSASCGMSMNDIGIDLVRSRSEEVTPHSDAEEKNSQESGIGSSFEDESKSGCSSAPSSPSTPNKVFDAITHYLHSFDMMDSEEELDSFNEEAEVLDPNELMLLTDNEDIPSWNDLIVSYEGHKGPGDSTGWGLQDDYADFKLDFSTTGNSCVRDEKINQTLGQLLGDDFPSLGSLGWEHDTAQVPNKHVQEKTTSLHLSEVHQMKSSKREEQEEPPASVPVDAIVKSVSEATLDHQDKVTNMLATIRDALTDGVNDNEDDTKDTDLPEEQTNTPSPSMSQSADTATPETPPTTQDTEETGMDNPRGRSRTKEETRSKESGTAERSVSCSDNIKAFLTAKPCAGTHKKGKHSECGDKHQLDATSCEASHNCHQKEDSSGKGKASRHTSKQRTSRRAVEARRNRRQQEARTTNFWSRLFCTTPVTVEGIAPDLESHDTDPEPLPPPIPPHGVDPTVVPEVRASSPLPVSDSAEPEVMTADEAQRLLSANILEGKVRESQGLLSDEEAQEVVLLLSPQEQDISKVAPPVPPHLTDSVPGAPPRYSDMPPAVPPHYADSAPPVPPHYTPGEDEYDTRVASHFDPTLTSPLSPEEEPSEADSSEASGDICKVSRVKEVLVEDGVHYLEDGHFWVEVPGLPDEDEDEDIDPNMPFHPHTKLTFSKDPVQVFSTYSVTEYDRKNDDVDPVAASAEYELEKRVEKMDLFPVEIVKGEGGLGLSIIGMGVGADAGVEKLGIFVKTITPNGATERDARIQVNDQIIEVDGKSLVGVTQVFAASVLKNTSGRVHFLIGREKDPENSEVALLIKQSLQADREREERRRALGGPDYDPHTGHTLFDPLSSPSEENSRSEEASVQHNYASYMEGAASPTSPEAATPPPEVFDLEGDTSDTSPENDVTMLKLKLKEVQYKHAVAEAEITKLKMTLLEMEKVVTENTQYTSQLLEAQNKMTELDGQLQSKLSEVSTYQDMLEQSQGQFIVLEKKYYKAKKIIKEYQGRERDFLHREEYHITQLEDKDSHYNALVKALKDRVIHLEAELTNAQKKAGMPVQVPTDPNTQPAYWNLQQSAQSALAKQPPRKPSLCTLDPEISDTETSDTGTSEGEKANTVERKLPVKEELDEAVPPHELLDVSASRAKGELASRGGLANRHLPSLKKTTSMSSASSQDQSLDDSSLDDDLPEAVKHPPVEAPPDGQQDQGSRRELDSDGTQHREPSPSKRSPTSLMEDVRQAVLQADVTLGKKPVISAPVPLSSTAHVVAQGQAVHPVSSPQRSQSAFYSPGGRESMRDSNAGSQSPRLGRSSIHASPVSSVSANPSGVVLLSQRPLDSSIPTHKLGPGVDGSSGDLSSGPASLGSGDEGSGASLGSQSSLSLTQPPTERTKRSHMWQTAPVVDWTKEQVSQWLVVQGLESCVGRFQDIGMTGPRLLNLDIRDLKSLGLPADEKSKLKRKVKELRIAVEKERKQAEKEKKEREKLQKKAEKLAEKAEKKKK